MELRFSKLVGQTHSTIWTIINKIRLEVAADETELAQIELGVPQQKRQNTVYKKIQIQLKKLCEDYNKDMLLTRGPLVLGREGKISRDWVLSKSASVYFGKSQEEKVVRKKQLIRESDTGQTELNIKFGKGDVVYYKAYPHHLSKAHQDFHTVSSLN
ncbi:hypothetical protein QTP88_005225 [Uroleucon formosanum]